MLEIFFCKHKFLGADNFKFCSQALQVDIGFQR